jgi:phage terminase large subunit
MFEIDNPIETEVQLNKFKWRDYQLPLLDALENKRFKRAIAIWPRRAGKDVVAFNYLIRCALRKIGVYFLVYPTYSQGRKILWESMTNEGQRFLDFIPKELIESTNSTEMKIRLMNQSLIQVVGSDNYDSLVGTNPCGIVFSEQALQDPRAYQFLRPVLTANNGWALFISTPRGKNHFYELYQIAISNPDHWFSSKLTVNETGHISLADIQREKMSGEMSEDLIQQEYFTSFEMGIEGAYYAKYIDKLKLDGRIGIVPFESGFKVHSCWDIGVRDSTSIIFFQCIGQTVRLIDCYENSKQGLEHYAKICQQKAAENNWNWGRHFAPHDIAVKEWGSGMTRLEKAKQLGITFTVTPNIALEDGIEALRSAFSKFWIDEVKCKQLIKSLENYRQEWDEKKKVYKAIPLHNWASHFADSARYLAVNLPKTRDGLSPEDLDKMRNEARYGAQSNMPSVFRDDLPNY